MSVDYLHTTLYNQRGVVVTDQWLIINGKWFAVSDLYYLERARGPMSAATRAALLVGLAELLVVAPVAFVFNTPTAWAVAGLDVLAAAGGVAFCGRRWPATFQLWAEYQGRPTLLFSTGDEQEFGQVSRALIRAVERGQLT
ncbi:DUF6232 family protein [Phytohabitans rumicis]|uniref:Uncharacterized protein n=1 Tax=Phytohabitans rumicis TaxID=1076125 RepID=A0A6V8LCJ2_9ACTN|nr:DUF6232 family protein [Phytohabitans rumicis]GFJ92718.1 hypothetical protein Prum_063600 [Phytohabitans rumicis]